MQEGGILNREITRLLARMGHMDELIVCDAGFPIPDGVDTVDLALSENRPRVTDVLGVLKTHFSVEKLVVADETREHSPSMLSQIQSVLGATDAFGNHPSRGLEIKKPKREGNHPHRGFHGLHQCPACFRRRRQVACGEKVGRTASASAEVKLCNPVPDPEITDI